MNMTLRGWLIRWLLLVSIAHVLVGAVLPWMAAAPVFDAYHGSIEAAFWPGGAPAGARDLQTWWIALFGPTVQLMALWMIALIHLADRLRQPQVWLWLMVGLVIWAPQDIIVSLRAACWAHVWVDVAALVAMLPPLFWLWRHDRAAVAS
ncbi:cell division protein [Massilia sp. IC2-278]|uniref:cell division protein n=1 Tax=Massilia sp. IC2-278 TaxID=2887200 RepID=UPI0027D9A5B3|nr:cell division protein [Massilia sp. IC2-278]